MPTKRETILVALEALLVSGLSVPVLRNQVLPEEVPAVGLVILRDGDPGEPEVTLSPPTYDYEHRAEVEVFFEAGSDIDTGLDAICAEIGQVIATDRTLAGLCDWIETGAPETDDLALEGADTIKAAILPLSLHYWTSDPLA